MIVRRDKSFLTKMGQSIKVNSKLAARWVKNNKVKSGLGAAGAIAGSVYLGRKSKGEVKSDVNKVTDAIIDNPKETAAYIAGDLVVPGILAKKALKKWPTGKGKVIAGGLGVYAASPVGLTSLAIAAKHKRESKKANTTKKN